MAVLCLLPVGEGARCRLAGIARLVMHARVRIPNASLCETLPPSLCCLFSCHQHASCPAMCPPSGYGAPAPPHPSHPYRASLPQVVSVSVDKSSPTCCAVLWHGKSSSAALLPRRSLMGALGMGSVSDFCVQHVACPVLVVKEQPNQQPAVAGPEQ